MKFVKKLVLIIVLIVTTFIRCSLFDGELWEKARKERIESGEVCERNEKGYWSCYDTK